MSEEESTALSIRFTDTKEEANESVFEKDEVVIDRAGKTARLHDGKTKGGMATLKTTETPTEEILGHPIKGEVKKGQALVMDEMDKDGEKVPAWIGATPAAGSEKETGFFFGNGASLPDGMAPAEVASSIRVKQADVSVRNEFKFYGKDAKVGTTIPNSSPEGTVLLASKPEQGKFVQFEVDVSQVLNTTATGFQLIIGFMGPDINGTTPFGPLAFNLVKDGANKILAMLAHGKTPGSSEANAQKQVQLTDATFDGKVLITSDGYRAHVVSKGKVLMDLELTKPWATFLFQILILGAATAETLNTKILLNDGSKPFDNAAFKGHLSSKPLAEVATQLEPVIPPPEISHSDMFNPGHEKLGMMKGGGQLFDLLSGVVSGSESGFRLVPGYQGKINHDYSATTTAIYSAKHGYRSLELRTNSGEEVAGSLNTTITSYRDCYFQIELRSSNPNAIASVCFHEHENRGLLAYVRYQSTGSGYKLIYKKGSEAPKEIASSNYSYSLKCFVRGSNLYIYHYHESKYQVLTYFSLGQSNRISLYNKDSAFSRIEPHQMPPKDLAKVENTRSRFSDALRSMSHVYKPEALLPSDVFGASQHFTNLSDYRPRKPHPEFISFTHDLNVVDGKCFGIFMPTSINSSGDDRVYRGVLWAMGKTKDKEEAKPLYFFYQKASDPAVNGWKEVSAAQAAAGAETMTEAIWWKQSQIPNIGLRFDSFDHHRLSLAGSTPPPGYGALENFKDSAPGLMLNHNGNINDVFSAVLNARIDTEAPIIFDIRLGTPSANSSAAVIFASSDSADDNGAISKTTAAYQIREKASTVRNYASSVATRTFTVLIWGGGYAVFDQGNNSPVVTSSNKPKLMGANARKGGTVTLTQTTHEPVIAKAREMTKAYGFLSPHHQLKPEVLNLDRINALLKANDPRALINSQFGTRVFIEFYAGDSSRSDLTYFTISLVRGEVAPSVNMLKPEKTHSGVTIPSPTAGWSTRPDNEHINVYLPKGVLWAPKGSPSISISNSADIGKVSLMYVEGIKQNPDNNANQSDVCRIRVKRTSSASVLLRLECNLVYYKD